MSQPDAAPTWTPLSAKERRVLGVLVEKQKTTPDAYPLSVAALVTGSNQKSNRDPVTNYDADDIEEILLALRKKGAAIQVDGSGRVVRWKHALYDWLDLRNQPVAMAVLAELMLRGAQTEGDLRSRAGRMDPMPELEGLHALLETLAARGLIVFLSPPGQRRGIVVTHGLYPPEELARVRQTAQAQALAHDDEPAPRVPGPRVEPAGPGLAAELAALRAEVAELREAFAAARLELKDLRNSLGD